VGLVASLSVFGLVLALLWSPAWSWRQGYQLAAMLFAAAIGFLAGGFVVAWLGGRAMAAQGAIFGLLFGLFSFTYVVGPGWYVLSGALLAGALGFAGGGLAGQARSRMSGHAR
jgi:hypothetical protein